jgi:hypothetical protein
MNAWTAENLATACGGIELWLASNVMGGVDHHTTRAVVGQGQAGGGYSALSQNGQRGSDIFIRARISFQQPYLW